MLLLSHSNLVTGETCVDCGKKQDQPKRNHAAQTCGLQWDVGSLAPPQAPSALWVAAQHQSCHGIREKLWEAGVVGGALADPEA